MKTFKLTLSGLPSDFYKGEAYPINVAGQPGTIFKALYIGESAIDDKPIFAVDSRIDERSFHAASIIDFHTTKSRIVYAQQINIPDAEKVFDAMGYSGVSYNYASRSCASGPTGPASGFSAGSSDANYSGYNAQSGRSGDYNWTTGRSGARMRVPIVTDPWYKPYIEMYKKDWKRELSIFIVYVSLVYAITDSFLASIFIPAIANIATMLLKAPVLKLFKNKSE